jgi:cytochrome c-type biogenesis protein CcmH/NrfG
MPAVSQAPSGAVSDQEKQIQKFYYMGIAYYTQGEYQKAIAEWQKVLALDKNNVLAINNIQKARKKMEYVK